MSNEVVNATKRQELLWLGVAAVQAVDPERTVRLGDDALIAVGQRLERTAKELVLHDVTDAEWALDMGRRIEPRERMNRILEQRRKGI